MIEGVMILKEAKLKVTPTRLRILDLFGEGCDPLSAEDITKRLKRYKTDQVTVYRTLDAFEKVRILTRVDLRRDAAFYELASHHHHHIVCTGCGRTEELEDCGMEAKISKVLKTSRSFKSISGHSFELFGVCKSCAKA